MKSRTLSISKSETSLQLLKEKSVNYNSKAGIIKIKLFSSKKISLKSNKY